MDGQNERITAEKLASQWGAPFVTRDQRSLDRATGGLLNPRTMANLDSLGKGPAGRLRMGRKIVYPSGSFFEWLVSRLKPASEGCGKAVGES